MSAGDVTQGRRLPDGFHYKDSEPGDYWRQIQGLADEHDSITPDMVRGRDWEWTIRDPDGRLGGLGKHQVEEHEDGTITVTPSILHDYPHAHLVEAGIPSIAGPGWHGYLERGVWREV